MNVDYVNPFISSLVEVLRTMASTDPKRGALSLKEGAEALGIVSGRIDLKSPQANGSLAISFTAPAILSVFNNMLGETRDSVDEEVADLVGELTNMASGGAKRLFAEQGYDFGMDTPEILNGEGHVIKHTVKAPVVLVPFSTEAGEFYIEVCFRDKR